MGAAYFVRLRSEWRNAVDTDVRGWFPRHGMISDWHPTHKELVSVFVEGKKGRYGPKGVRSTDHALNCAFCRSNLALLQIAIDPIDTLCHTVR